MSSPDTPCNTDSQTVASVKQICARAREQHFYRFLTVHNHRRFSALHHNHHSSHHHHTSVIISVMTAIIAEARWTQDVLAAAAAAELLMMISMNIWWPDISAAAFLFVAEFCMWVALKAICWKDFGITDSVFGRKFTWFHIEKRSLSGSFGIYRVRDLTVI